MAEQNSVRVLLIEDDSTDSAHLQRLLQGTHKPALEFMRLPTLAEAIDWLTNNEPPGLIITDLTLPDSHGIETFLQLHERASRIPIIVLTGIENEALALEAVAQGAQDYLPKRTADRELLTRSIRYALARHRSEQELRESEERYALAVRGSDNGVWDWQLDTNHIYFSPRWKSIIGHGEDDLTNDAREWFSRIHPEDQELVHEKLHAHLDDLTSHFYAEYRMRHADGSWVWVLTRGVAVRDRAGVAMRIAGSHGDITSRKAAEQQLVHNAFHDALTGLPNRALFHDRLDRSIRRMGRNRDHCFAVLFLDVDRFKHVNDSKGHEFGDRILVEIARRLEHCIRPGDTIARLGGDEFVILAEEVADAEDALGLSRRIHDQLAKPLLINGEIQYCSVSVGIAMSAQHYQLPEQLIRDADTAMYRAKAKGRSTSELFDKAMHDTAVAILQLENDLRQAIEHNQFEVYYQPIINLKTGRIRGFEALARWRHPRSGLIPPLHFIPLAEETGLIGPIGWWILREAATQMVVWHKQFPADPPLTISVNVSNRQFNDPHIIDRVRQVLRETKLPPSALVLEITESVLISDYESNAAIIQQLRNLGIEIHIDDFGIGYSSLSHLRHFATDNLKIDKSFISSMAEGQENREIVKTIVSLARNLGMRSTAEGLETAAQLEQARHLECEDGQGFFFSEPRDSGETERLLNSDPQW